MTHDERFDRIDANIERLNDRVERVEASVTRIEANIDRPTQYVLDFRQETAQHFEVIDNRLDALTATVNNIEARFPTLTKGILDFGKIATQLTNEQFKNRHANAELTARVERLEEKIAKLIDPAA
jgi:prefoldin subunit 5